MPISVPNCIFHDEQNKGNISKIKKEHANWTLHIAFSSILLMQSAELHLFSSIL